MERQSPTEVPQFFLLDGTARKQLTENKDLFPDLTGAQKQRVIVERADGIKFPINVMMPPGWKPGAPKPPAIFWFYPREFADQDAIDRPDRTFNKNTFQNFGTRSMQFLVRLGYAVVVDTPGALPIVGPAGQQNNNYVNDLRNSLAAMIDELDAAGWSTATGWRSAATATARSRPSTRWCTRRSSRRASRATARTTGR